MIVAFYARVSSDEQRERQTVATQLEYARARARIEGWELVEFVDDGVSGTVPLARRPGGAALLESARAGAFTLATSYRLDRLGRTQRVVLDAIDALKAGGVRYRSLTEPFEVGTPFGDAALGMTSVFAQLERDTFVERTMAGISRVARQPGRWLGGVVPYGYLLGEDRCLIVDERPLPERTESPADVVREIYRLCTEEGRSTRRIAAELNARGVPGPKTRWHDSFVGRILTSSIYRGEHVFAASSRRREPIARPMPLIVSAAVFERAQRQLRENDTWLRAHPKRLYLLRGLLACGECGHRMIGYSWRRDRTTSRRVRAYRCLRPGHRFGPRAIVVREEWLEPFLWREVLRFLENPDETLRAAARAASTASLAENDAEQELLALAGEVRELEEQEGRLLDAELGRLFSRQVISGKLAELHARRGRVDRRMAEVRAERARAARAEEESADLRRSLAALAERARTASEATKAEIYRLLIRRAEARLEGQRLTVRVGWVFRQPGVSTDALHASA